MKSPESPSPSEHSSANNSSNAPEFLSWEEELARREQVQPQVEQIQPSITSEQFQADQELLNSDSSQNILPFLTLEHLSPHEQADLLRFSAEVTDKINQNDTSRNISAFDFLTRNTIADIANEGDTWHQQRRISPKLAEANKLFCASILNSINESSNPNHLQENCYNILFSYSPNLFDSCGDLKNTLELLAIADRSPLAWDLRESIIGDYSFTDHNHFKDALPDASPITQLQILPVMYGLTKSCDPHSYSNAIISQVSEVFQHLRSSPDTTPFVRLMAKQLDHQINQRINTKWVDISPTDPTYSEIMGRRSEHLAQIQQRQSLLHAKFPNLPPAAQLVQIAPDFVATLHNGHQLDIITNAAQEQTSLLNPQPDNPFHLTRDSAYLLATAHHPNMQPSISDQLGLELSDISLSAQIQLLKYMTQVDDTKFNTLCHTMHTLPQNLRLQLAENFLAADFGEDFGDSLLSIANSDHISHEQFGEILTQIDSCRSSIHTITDLYQDVNDGEFTAQYARAANERLTDAITVFSTIAHNGTATAELPDWIDPVTFDYSSAIQALTYEAESLSIISGTLNDLSTGHPGASAELFLHPDNAHQRSYYNLYSPNHGHILLYVRSEGSNTFDPTYEYGKFRSRYNESVGNGGVEASISLIVDPVDPFKVPDPTRPDRHKTKDLTYYDNNTMNKVSAIRIDREGRTPNTPTDDPNREPVNPRGTISVDLAAINDRADTPSGQIARLLSIGNQLRGDKHNVESTLNHNTNWFDQDIYGRDTGFKELARYISFKASTWCAEHPMPTDQSIVSAMQAKAHEQARATRHSPHSRPISPSRQAA